MKGKKKHGKSEAQAKNSKQFDIVIDASAILAMIFKEPGFEIVAEVLSSNRAAISSVNLSEVVFKLIKRGATKDFIRNELDRLPLIVVDFDKEQSYHAAGLYPSTKGFDISFADRACLALGFFKSVPVLTADGDWAKLQLNVEVKLIRESKPSNLS